MATSQNGWTVHTSSNSMTPFKWVTGRVLPGDVHYLFNHLCSQFNARVEKIIVAHSWGYAYRSIRGQSTGYSNHASGTAIDLNAPAHPLGKVNTFSAKQKAEIHAILKAYEGAIRWGGDYSGRKDEMHFEINASQATVKRVAQKLGYGKGGPTPTKPPVKPTPATKTPLLKEGVKGAVVKNWQKAMNKTFPAYSKLAVDGIYGPASSRVAKEFQKRSGLAADGIVGPATWKELAKYKITPTGTTKPPVKPTPTPKPADTSAWVKGMDSSEYQGNVDWAKVKADGVKFVIHKLGGSNRGGKLYLDKNYKANAAAAKKAGLINGHYFFNGKVAGDKEAQYFLDNLTAYTRGDAIVYDFETDAANNVKTSVPQALAFFKRILKSSQEANLWLYLNESTYNSTDLSAVEALGVKIWLAKYSTAEPKLTSKTNKNKYHMWQHTSSGLVKGIKGKVDLNKVKALRLLKAPATKKKVELKIVEVSLQFSDTDAQQKADVEAIFKRGGDIIMGTEAGHGSGNTAKYLAAACEKYGYHFSKPGRFDTWVATKKSIVKPGTYEHGGIFGLDRSSRTKPKPAGRWGDKGVVWASFTHEALGEEVAVGAVHNLTWRGAGTAYKNESDKIYAEAMKGFSLKHPKGFCFVGGDFNRNDKTGDVFRGIAPFVTAADELKKWPSTGHGPIDAVARRKTDKGVRVKSWKVLGDKALPLHTDHFYCEAVYELSVE